MALHNQAGIYQHENVTEFTLENNLIDLKKKLNPVFSFSKRDNGK